MWSMPPNALGVAILATLLATVATVKASADVEYCRDGFPITEDDIIDGCTITVDGYDDPPVYDGDNCNLFQLDEEYDPICSGSLGSAVDTQATSTAVTFTDSITEEELFDIKNCCGPAYKVTVYKTIYDSGILYRTLTATCCNSIDSCDYNYDQEYRDLGIVHEGGVGDGCDGCNYKIASWGLIVCASGYSECTSDEAVADTSAVRCVDSYRPSWEENESYGFSDPLVQFCC